MIDPAFRRAGLELRHAVESALSAVLPQPAPGAAAASPAGLVVGVSGGEDSRVLLHVLSGLVKSLRLRLEVCHVDHGLRPESAEEAAFVESLAAGAGANYHLSRPAPREPSENVESWG